MSYLAMGTESPPFRAAVEDGPITSPSQVDDSVIVSDGGVKRVPCSELPADSPYRRPGALCEMPFNIVDMFTDLMGKIGQALSTSPPTSTTEATSSGAPVALLVGGAAVAAYFLLKKKKRT